MSRRNLFESRNPIMTERSFKQSTQEVGQPSSQELVGIQQDTMTVAGAVNKSLLLSTILMISAIAGYVFASPIVLWGGMGIGLVLVLVAVFKTHWSPFIAPAYAFFEGLFVGAISAMYASAFDGIIFHAVSLTMAVLFLMLFLYKSGIIKVTQKLRAGVMMATGAVIVVYVLSFVLGFFGIEMPFLHDAGPIGMGISLVIIGIASMNLLLDFDNFDKGAQMGSPKYMEWFCAMGLLITLVWLYVEILRFLAILNSSD